MRYYIYCKRFIINVVIKGVYTVRINSHPVLYFIIIFLAFKQYASSLFAFPFAKELSFLSCFLLQIQLIFLLNTISFFSVFENCHAVSLPFSTNIIMEFCLFTFAPILSNDILNGYTSTTDILNGY